MYVMNFRNMYKLTMFHHMYYLDNTFDHIILVRYKDK